MAEATSKPGNQRLRALEVRVVPKDVETGAKREHYDRLEGRMKIAEERASLISTTIRKHSP